MSNTTETVNLAKLLKTPPTFVGFDIWLVGDTPLITHAWSEKAKREMLTKQIKTTKSGKEDRDPHKDFLNSLYELAPDVYGFPAMGVKNCILSAAHKDKGVPRSTVQSALFINADMKRLRPGMAGAICDMPLLRIWGSKPEMREDMVKIGGMTKTAALAYRAQFTRWAINVSGRFNSAVLSPEQLTFLISEGGEAYGLGEWRNERRGMFGAFHMASPEEAEAWVKYATTGGEIPASNSYEEIG